MGRLSTKSMRPSTLNYSRCRARLRGGRGDSVKFRLLSPARLSPPNDRSVPVPRSPFSSSPNRRCCAARGERGDEIAAAIRRELRLHGAQLLLAGRWVVRVRARPAISPGSLRSSPKHANKSSANPLLSPSPRGLDGRFTARGTARRFRRRSARSGAPKLI